MALGGIGHLPQAWPEGQCRSVHQRQAHVAVGATATAVDQAGFGRQVGLVDQRLDGQVGQLIGQRQPLRA
ncbi:hypothetical protein D3C85_1893520 [compost metagenome]